MSGHYRYTLCAALLLLQAACVASNATKVRCDSNLTPINAASVPKP